MLSLRYNFELPDGSMEEFEYEAAELECLHALRDKVSLKEILRNWYLTNYTFSSDADKEALATYGLTADVNSIDELSDEDVEDLIYNNQCYDLEQFLDILKPSFEVDARELFDESNSFKDDPYSYNGVSESDFH